MLIKDYALDEGKAALRAYLQDNEPDYKIVSGGRPAVLILPGGGYEFVSPRESEPIALAYLAKGFQAFTLRYTIKEGGAFPLPQLQAFAAIKLMRDNAGLFGIDKNKIAAVGFSAGGHLAASMGVHCGLKRFTSALKTDKEMLRPNATVLVYPCISTKDFGYAGIKSVHGKNLEEDELKLLSLEDYVTNDTPPSFICHTADDPTVSAMNSLAYAQGLAKNKVEYELHIFKNGNHGMNLASKATVQNIDLLDDSLKKMLSDSKVLNYVRESMRRFAVWLDMSVEFLYSCFEI